MHRLRLLRGHRAAAGPAVAPCRRCSQPPSAQAWRLQARSSPLLCPRVRAVLWLGKSEGEQSSAHAGLPSELYLGGTTGAARSGRDRLMLEQQETSGRQFPGSRL